MVPIVHHVQRYPAVSTSASQVCVSTHRRTAVARILYLVYHPAMANLRPIKSVRLSESVYEAIESAILQGELAPDSTVRDRQLADVLGVSRTPVRDALHRLECYGLVRQRDSKGWMVTGVEPKDIREVFELRRTLEPLGLEYLSRDWDETTVQELSSSFDDFPKPLPRELYPYYLKRDHDFHRRIVECARNSRLTNFYTSLSHLIDRIRHYLSYGYEGRVDASLAEHRQICGAIAARDLQAATEQLINHLSQVEQMFTELAQEHQLDQWLNRRST